MTFRPNYLQQSKIAASSSRKSAIRHHHGSGVKVAILGFAREGQSTLKFLMKSPHYKGAEFSVLDRRSGIEVPKGVYTILGPRHLSRLSDFDYVFRTPGIPYLHAELTKAKRRGTTISSLTKLFFDEAKRKGVKIIGVTGTKGKGTTSTLLYEILKAHSTNSGQAKNNVALAGNIGKPALEVLPRLKEGSWVVLELSSFQLQDLEVSPEIAVVLEVFPDHQDSHKTLAEYYRAKAVIARHQKNKDSVFFFVNHQGSRKVAAPGKGKKISVDPTHWTLFGPDDLRIPGAHNFRNAVMAASVAQLLGTSDTTILEAVKKFRGTPHRLEFVRAVNNVSFYDDSASTNPQTTAAAVRAFPRHANVLIAGGYDKGLEYAPLAKAIKGSTTEFIILFGANKEKIKRALAKKGLWAVEVPDLKAALTRAYREAVLRSIPCVIFSPGAASFDMFKNYADRGDQFKAFVRGLK